MREIKMRERERENTNYLETAQHVYSSYVVCSFILGIPWVSRLQDPKVPSPALDGNRDHDMGMA